MSTGNESPQSVSITGYYKGFSVIITKRDADAKVKPLIDGAMVAIDYMIEQSFLPSWNKQTSAEALSPQKPLTTNPVASQDYSYEPTHKPVRTVVPGGKVDKDNCAHDLGWTEQISHSEKNPDRHFKQCDKCRAFLGWVGPSL